MTLAIERVSNDWSFEGSCEWDRPEVTTRIEGRLRSPATVRSERGWEELETDRPEAIAALEFREVDKGRGLPHDEGVYRAFLTPDRQLAGQWFSGSRPVGRFQLSPIGA